MAESERFELPMLGGGPGLLASIELWDNGAAGWTWRAVVNLRNVSEVIVLEQSEETAQLQRDAPSRGWAFSDAIASVQRTLFLASAQPSERDAITAWTRTLNGDFIPWPMHGQSAT